VYRAGRQAGITQIVVHTGQHYDDSLSRSFFDDLEMPAPELNLEVGSLSHAAQTARIMERIEPVLVRERPDWLVVYGDVNSTAAAALVAAKLGIRIAHVEAGLRSFDRTMPEEINRLVTDRLADLLLVPSRDAAVQLRAEGEPDEEIVFVGNVMIDTLCHSLRAASQTGFRRSLGLGDDAVVVTLHRPSNVDDTARMRLIAQALRSIADERPVVFPVHPRTAQRLRDEAISFGAVRLLEPLRYLEMLDLVAGAFAVVTDSGGLQEETTALGIPCFTVRQNTERPITITEGTNRLVPDPVDLPRLVRAATRPDVPKIPEGWDGHAAARIIQAFVEKSA
jgi:UDP-N-acetylglucosamine 2-epimerase (non-hydrolysing)